MKINFKNLSIKYKIVILITLVSTISMLFALFIFSAYDKSEFEIKTLKSISILAEVISNNSTATVAFNDSYAATELLQSLKVEKHIQKAFIFLPNNDTLAFFRKDSLYNSEIILPVFANDSSILTDNSLIIIKPIIDELNKELIIGRVYIESDLKEYSERLNHFLNLVLLILLSSMAIAFVLSLQMQKVISLPILNLNTIMREISVKKDYSVRITKKSNDEIGRLIVGFNEMLTQIEKQNLALTLSREEALKSAKIKEEFLANMSHEIRTPMNAIMGMSNLMLDTKLNHSQKEYLRHIKNSSDNLLVIINDILDFSKIEAGKIEFEKAEFNLQDTLSTIYQSFKYKTDEQELDFIVKIEENVPETLVGDYVRLNQILLNLIGNAIKFTKKGGVTLAVSKVVSGDKDVTICFDVKDTGIGISKGKLNTIFSSFSQASSDTTRKYGGTGLGLTISKQLVELQGGSIKVSSVVGEGSKFSFNITYGVVNENFIDVKKELFKAKEQTKTNYNNYYILVVEDNKINQIVAKSILQNKGFKIDLAADGQIAINMMSINKYDLILLDLHMPNMDGYETATYLREKEKNNIPIIALTAAAIKGEKEKCLSYGMNDYVSKPFQPEELISTIDKYLIKKEEIKTKDDNVSILVVEDNKINQLLAVKILTKNNFTVKLAENGQIALDLLSKNKYNLVLMDLHMPVMDGYDASINIRKSKNESIRDIPIIALTGAAKEEKNRCLSIGMNDYISKPYDAVDLINKINKYIKHGKG